MENLYNDFLEQLAIRNVKTYNEIKWHSQKEAGDNFIRLLNKSKEDFDKDLLAKINYLEKHIEIA